MGGNDVPTVGIAASAADEIADDGANGSAAMLKKIVEDTACYPAFASTLIDSALINNEGESPLKTVENIMIRGLEDEGFNVVSAEIGPNKMSQNTRYIYDQNISNAIIFLYRFHNLLINHHLILF